MAKAQKRTFEVAEQLTFPTLKIAEGSTHNVIILGIETKPDIDKKTGQQKVDPNTGEKKDISIMRVDNLDDDQKQEVVLNAVLHAVILEAGIKEGDAIQFTKHPKKEGKSYHTFSVSRLKLG